MVRDDITRIEKGRKWISIIANVVLPGGWGGFCVMDKIQK